MKILITKGQFNKLREQRLRIGDSDDFENDFDKIGDDDDDFVVYVPKAQNLKSAYNPIINYIENGSEGDLDIDGLPIESLFNLKTVNGGISAIECKSLKSLGRLSRVESYAFFNGCALENFGELEFIGGDLWASNCFKLKTLSRLSYIGGVGHFTGCKLLEDLGKLWMIPSHLHLVSCKSLETTCDIEIVGGDLDLTNCFSFKLFKKLLVVKGDLYVDGCKLLSDFGSLQDVGGKIHIGETPLEEMYKSGELEKMYPQFKGKFVI